MGLLDWLLHRHSWEPWRVTQQFAIELVMRDGRTTPLDVGRCLIQQRQCRLCGKTDIDLQSVKVSL